jgi:WD40 repeat protein
MERDGKLRIWGVERGPLEILTRIAAPGGPSGALAVSPDGLLASAALASAVQLRSDAGVGLEELQQLSIKNGGPVASLAFSPDGGLLAVGTRSGRLLLFRRGELGFELVVSLEAT